eukprot:3737982-Prymnesium_polylepis.2
MSTYSADFAGGLDLRNLCDLLKGMRRELGDTPSRPRYHATVCAHAAAAAGFRPVPAARLEQSGADVACSADGGVLSAACCVWLRGGAARGRGVQPAQASHARRRAFLSTGGRSEAGGLADPPGEEFRPAHV